MNWVLRLDSFGVIAVLDAFDMSLSVALNSPRRRRVADEAVDEIEMGLHPPLA